MLNPSSNDNTRHAAASGSSHDMVPSAIPSAIAVAISRCQAMFNREGQALLIVLLQPVGAAP